MKKAKEVKPKSETLDLKEKTHSEENKPFVPQEYEEYASTEIRMKPQPLSPQKEKTPVK